MMKSIGTKLILQIALAIIVVMLIFGFLESLQQKRQFTHFLDAKEENSLQQLSLITGELLYYINLEAIAQIVNAYLEDTEIWAIKIMEGEEVITHVGKDPATQELLDFTQDDRQSPSYTNALVRSKSLIYEGQEIGTLEMVFSRQSIQGQIQETMLTLSANLVVIVLLESLLVFLLIKRNITTPLLTLARAAKQIADGDIDIRLKLKKISARHEIGVLTAAFENMIAYVQHIAQSATRISVGELQQDVDPRSEKDVLGHAFQQMSEYLNEIALVATALADGDLRQKVQPRTEHDILGMAFQRMESFRHAMGQIMNGAELLGDASQGLTQVSAQMASGAEQISQQVHVVSSNSRHISQNVSELSAAIEELAVSIREISRNVSEVMNIISSAVDITNVANTTIAKLEKSSQEIGDIVKVITTITQQTNLLALNATIEAARAGEVGKGFTVVASEIKELARETAASAGDIIHKVETIQENSIEATDAILNVSEITRQVHDLSTSIAASIEEQTATTNEISRNIADAAHGSDEITRTITEVATTSQEASNQAAVVQSTAQEFAALAEELRHLVEKFKI